MSAECPTYHEDFYAWTQYQAALLHMEKWQELDYVNLAEELESLGKRDLRELESRLEVLIMRLLTWRYQPARRQRGRSWQSTILEQRGRLQRLLAHSPSLRPHVALLIAAGYPRTRQRALAETRLAESVLPLTCPWPEEQILDDAFWPEEHTCA